MTAPHIIDPAGMLGEALSQASPDLMRSLLQHVINALLSADADAVCGARWGQQDPQRHAQRIGYRYRPLDTRVGTIDVAIPKLRSGTYFPQWLLQRRKRTTSPPHQAHPRRIQPTLRQQTCSFPVRDNPASDRLRITLRTACSKRESSETVFESESLA